MEPLLKSDIFFFISSIVFIIIAVLLLVALSYIIKIVRLGHDILVIIKDTTRELSTKVGDVGGIVEGSTVMKLASLFLRRKRKSKK